ncbi:MAG: hypothetical protein PWQ10_531 [Patescibacteria group bacterium]|nr:hypothetical protein [Patescibacteria group bacterium]
MEKMRNCFSLTEETDTVTGDYKQLETVCFDPNQGIPILGIFTFPRKCIFESKSGFEYTPKLEQYLDKKMGTYNENFWIDFKNDHQLENKRNNIAIAFVDINGLKDINDTIGHEAGDEYLRQVAKFLQDNFRDEDMVIHIHGDEFLVVCENSEGIDEDGLRAHLESIQRKALAQEVSLNVATGINEDGSKECSKSIQQEIRTKKVSLSFAIGLAVFDNGEHSGRVDSCIGDTKDRADTAMRANKIEIKEEVKKDTPRKPRRLRISGSFLIPKEC